MATKPAKAPAKPPAAPKAPKATKGNPATGAASAPAASTTETSTAPAAAAPAASPAPAPAPAETKQAAAKELKAPVQRLDRLERARVLPEFSQSTKSKPAGAELTDIFSFKGHDGRTMNVVVIDGELAQQENEAQS